MTYNLRLIGLPYYISTHTPAWGVTVKLPFDSCRVYHFNSHARVGRDSSSVSSSLMILYFNSHARVGRDYVSLIGDSHASAFQLTRPRGA